MAAKISKKYIPNSEIHKKRFANKSLNRVFTSDIDDTTVEEAETIEISVISENGESLTNPISETELEELYHFSKSYEALINKRSRLYNERNLKNKNIKEADYKKLLLEHYTFLKRPILINEQEVFIGNNKKVVAAAKKSL